MSTGRRRRCQRTAGGPDGGGDAARGSVPAIMSASGQGTYKDTVNLPRTDFPMKGNLAQLEPRMLAWWAERDIWRKLLEKNLKHDRLTRAEVRLQGETAGLLASWVDRMLSR